MNDKELDKLLKESMQKEFPVPEDLDRRTRTEMNRINEMKAYRFTGILITISVLLTALVFIILLQFHLGWLHKFIISVVCFFLISLFSLFYVINYQTHLKKETIV